MTNIIYEDDIIVKDLKEMITNNAPELIILQNIKKNMINGEVSLEGLSSKQRQYLHELSEKYNMAHFSNGNYSNRVLTIKDKNHLYLDEEIDETSEFKSKKFKKKCNQESSECSSNDINVKNTSFKNFSVGEKCIYLLSLANFVMSSFIYVKLHNVDFR